ncbi:signal peptidase complex subunit 3 [Nematocida sp. LUAm3]|nr:signal peptidase complex subunit 3 [Nematocida sp. LUAm3]KAI5175906.1 signal peptidase complex subunit 3 [Nematocida sp. LUAm2]KAI5178712.1 signal peptidase complex subunit 3 [Nematocida sp. LUAm1]
MNTLSKRAYKVVSTSSTYITMLVLLIFMSTLLTNRGNLPCSPSAQLDYNNSIVFTPNINLQSTISYNVKEIYVYLVHRIEKNQKVHERTIWDTLITRSPSPHLKERIKISINDKKRPLSQGEFHLRATYFPYIGIIKHKTFAVFNANSSSK